MLASVNRVVLVGQIGRYSPTLSYTGSGSAVCSFMLAVVEVGSDQKEHTLLVPVQVWGKRAEDASTLEPGQSVLVEGKLARKKSKAGEWEWTVSTFHIQALGPATAAPSMAAVPAGQPVDDDMPF